MKIIIDAGHGGKDPGACRIKNGKPTYEKDIALHFAFEIGRRLKARGNTVIYTRRVDKYIKLEERTDISNRNNADLFISLHCNGYANKDAHGGEIWVSKDASDTTREFAKNLFYSLYESHLPLDMRIGDRGLMYKEQNFYVLKHTKAPAVLIELGFISNDGDFHVLTDSGWVAYYSALIDYAISKHFVEK